MTEPAESLARAIEAVWELDEHAIVEHYAKGREVTCGVLDVAGGPTAFSPTEIRALKDEFYTYEARYAPGRSAHTCPADFSAETTARIRECAVRAHIALGCRDLSRVDFIVGDEADACSITLLEVNTLPGFTATSLFPEAAAVMGLPMAALCDQLIRHAVARGVPRRATPKALPT